MEINRYSVPKRNGNLRLRNMRGLSVKMFLIFPNSFWNHDSEYCIRRFPSHAEFCFAKIVSNFRRLTLPHAYKEFSFCSKLLSNCVKCVTAWKPVKTATKQTEYHFYFQSQHTPRTFECSIARCESPFKYIKAAATFTVIARYVKSSSSIYKTMQIMLQTITMLLHIDRNETSKERTAFVARRDASIHIFDIFRSISIEKKFVTNLRTRSKTKQKGNQLVEVPWTINSRKSRLNV